MPDQNTLAAIDSALRLLDRELWIVTATDSQRRSGLLATLVSPASIDREGPVLLAALAPNHFTTELVVASKAFAAHLLLASQIDLAWNFASGSGRSRDKLAGLAIEHQATGSPVMIDCLAWFDCRVFAQYDAGDRLFLWGEVVAGGIRQATGACLREHEFFKRLTEEQRQALAADREADAARNRPLFERWRRGL